MTMVSTDEALRLVTRETVRLYKTHFGRGPERATTHWAGPDTVVCILEDTLTPAEQKLAELGQHKAIRDMRNAMQHATIQEFCAAVEAATGRKVYAFTSATDTLAKGLSVETWTLHPEGYEGPSKGDEDAAAAEFGRD